MMTRSPTRRLLVGLLVTIAAVTVFALYSLRQLAGLRQLQTDTIDRNRRNSLQLLRVQSDLNSLGMALRDMAQGGEPYGLGAYRSELERIRADLDDALKQEAALAAADRPSAQQQRLQEATRQFWQTADQALQMAANGQEMEARRMVGTQLSAQQASLSALVARLLVRNNEVEEQAGTAVAKIYAGVERNIYAFSLAMLGIIGATSLYLIYSNRRTFEKLESLSQQRRVLAGKLITVQEEVLRSVSRELHDEFGQILTAVGVMLTRAEKKGLPPDSPFRVELAEVKEITQSTLEKMRTLSQMLHPSVLDDFGLAGALEWYTQLFQKQTGIRTFFEIKGEVKRVTGQTAIHCFRIVQEALNNAVKHSQTESAEVSIGFSDETMELAVRDHGKGLTPHEKSGQVGIGLIAMKERAELMNGQFDILKGTDGGTIVSLRVPIIAENDAERMPFHADTVKEETSRS